MSRLDLLTLTATEAQELLTSNKLTSVELVTAYLDQIAKHNHAGLHINALISVAPRNQCLEAAKTLDDERRAGKLRSALHGIPFIVKDVFLTHPDLGMPTTAGGLCFRTAKAKRTAPLLQHLIDNQGMILLGKANLTEFCGLKMQPLQPGWSPAGGQTQNPYVFGGLNKAEAGKILPQSGPGGSSSGSGAGVAAGFAPLSIGTECVGSVVTPSNRCGLYALKAANGEVDDSGGFAYTDCIDAVGIMAKSARDLVPFAAAVMKNPPAVDLEAGARGLRVGWLDSKEWRLTDETADWNEDMREQMKKGYADAMQRLEDAGAKVKECREFKYDPEALKMPDGKSAFYEIASYQLLNKHLPKFFDELSESEVRSLEDIIKYNETHADSSMPSSHPSQHEYYDLLKTERTKEKTEGYISEMRRRGKNALDPLLESYDVLVALADSPLCMYTSAAGYPIACVPVGMLRYSDKNERPFGLCIAAGKGKEGLLLRFMAAFEAVMPPRPLPRPLTSLDILET